MLSCHAISMSARLFFACGILLCALASSLAVFSGCDGAKETATREKVTILAAASTTNAIEAAAQLFENENDSIAVRISTGPSNGLARQIMAGAPADVFLSANKQWADAIVSEGLSDTTIELLTNRMVLIVPQGNPAAITGPNDLTHAKVSRVAVAGENVPAGIYAEQALRRLNLFDSLRESNKLARGSDVRVTLAYVERAEVEAGIVYATDARLSEQVEIVAVLDPRTHEAVVYPLVLLKMATDKPAARQFFEFLQSAAGLAVFEKYGFTPLTSQP